MDIMTLNIISRKEIDLLKNKVNTFVNSLDGIENEDITFIIKKIIFFKILTDPAYKNLNIFFSRLISDLYCILDCINKGEIRYYFFNYRSFIENYLRLLMNVTVEENHITQDVFLQFKKNLYQNLVVN